MKKILITGSKGFIGSHLAEFLQRRYQIKTYDLDGLDFRQFETVSAFLKREQFEVIIHTATWSDTRVSSHSDNDVLANNLKMFFNLASCQKDFGKLLYFGSGAEYGRQSSLKEVKEDYFGKKIPADVYGLSKFIMAQYTLTSLKIFELIPFAVFGPGEDYRIRFISNAICRQLYNLPITIKKNLVYDYLYIDDLLKIIEWFIRNEPPEHRYNLCSGHPYDLLSLAKLVQKTGKSQKEIKIFKKGWGAEYSGSNEKLQKLIPGLKFTPMDEAISLLYRWYQNHQNLIKKDELFVDSK